MKGVMLVLSVSVMAAAGLKCKTTYDAKGWSVDCSGLSLSSTPPPVLLHPVHSLSLARNLIVTLRESQFINWTDISHLDLSFNLISSVDKTSFEGLNTLNELNLMNNELQVLSQNITKYLPKLRILRLSSNKLKIIDQGAFELCPLLIKVYLGSNLYLGSSLSSFSDIGVSLRQGLVSLDISNISLRNIPDNFFTYAGRLISLNVAYNPMKTISNIPSSLRHLNMSGTLLETVPDQLFLKSDFLQRLSLQNMPKLKDIKINAFNGLSNLDELFITNCPYLGFVSEEAFGETFPKLKRVVISNCGLITLSKKFQSLLSNTESVDLQGNPWICDSRISWIADLNMLPNFTSNLRCNKPPTAQGKLVLEYFGPRRPHPLSSLIGACIVVVMVAILVGSVVGMVRHLRKEKPKTYRPLQDIQLQEIVPHSLPPL